MTTVPSSRVESAALIQQISEGQVSREFILHAAKGFLAIPQEDLVAVLAYLANESDEEVSTLARASLGEMPTRIPLAYAQSTHATVRDLELLAAATDDAAVLEAVLRNRSTSDETVSELARHVLPYLQDVIVTNQERIIRHPAILDALLANTHLSNDVRRRALEVREEFFDKRVRVEALRKEHEELRREEVPLEPEEEEAIADLLAEAAQMENEPPNLPAVLDPDHMPAYVRIMNLSVAERVRLAYKGNKSERAVLIRESNKLVCTAVVRNPRLTENEIIAFAGSRNLKEEVLRIIGANRQWMARYAIMIALIRNPKAPIGVVLPLISRLTLKDLQSVGKDRGVSEVVRKTALKLGERRR